MNKYEEDCDGKLHPHCVNLTTAARVFPKEHGTRYLAANLNAAEAGQPIFTGTKRKVGGKPQKKRASSSSRKDKEGLLSFSTSTSRRREDLFDSMAIPVSLSRNDNEGHHSFSTSTSRRREYLFDSMAVPVSHSRKDSIISRFLRDAATYAGKPSRSKLAESEPVLNQRLRGSHDLPRKYTMPTKSAPSRKERFLKGETLGDRTLPERLPRLSSSEQTNGLDIEGEAQIRQFLSKESLDDLYRRPIDKKKKEGQRDRSLTDVNKRYKEERRKSLETKPYKTQERHDDWKVRAQRKTGRKQEDEPPRNIEKKTKAEAPRRTEKKHKPTLLEPMVTGRRQRYEDVSQKHGLMLPNGTRLDQSYPVTEKKRMPPSKQSKKKGQRKRKEPETFDLKDVGSELLDIMDFGDSDEDTEEDVAEEPQLPKKHEEITVSDEEVQDEEYHKDGLAKSFEISESEVEEDRNETEMEAKDDDYRRIDNEISGSVSDQWHEEEGKQVETEAKDDDYRGIGNNILGSVSDQHGEEGKEVEREANDNGNKEIYNENWRLETCNNKEGTGIEEYKEHLPVISNHKQQLETNEVSEEEVRPHESMTGLTEAHKITVEKEESPEELKTTVKGEVVDEDSEEDVSETKYEMQPNNEEDNDDEIDEESDEEEEDDETDEENDEEDDDDEIGEESDEEEEDDETDEESDEEDDDAEIGEEGISHDRNGGYDEEDKEEN